MKIIPAIDLKDGKCVRLREGKMDQEIIFSEDPVATASHWFSEGADLLHIVDLDGAVLGKPINNTIISRIASEFSSKQIQVGGGVRSFQIAEDYIKMGVQRVIMGTSAIESPEVLKEFSNSYPNQVVLGIDALNGKVKTEGWLKESGITPKELIEVFEGLPIAAIIFTDISKDGMMSGPNFEATSSLAKVTEIPVIASGGVSTLSHIKKLSEDKLIYGAICGRALYEKVFTYAEAVKTAESGS